MDSIDEIDWDEIMMYNGLAQGRFIFGLSLADELNIAHSKGLQHYYLAPVRTYAELQDLKRAGVCRITVTAPLFFDLEQVKKFNIPIYMTANSATQDALFERTDGITGCWIRPEDVSVYEPYIEVLNFTGTQSQEQALYRIYAEHKKWSGEINLIIPDTKSNAVNRMITPDFAKARLSCQQRCMRNESCHLCYQILQLADPKLLSQLKENS